MFPNRTVWFMKSSVSSICYVERQDCCYVLSSFCESTGYDSLTPLNHPEVSVVRHGYFDCTIEGVCLALKWTARPVGKIVFRVIREYWSISATLRKLFPDLWLKWPRHLLNLSRTKAESVVECSKKMFILWHRVCVPFNNIYGMMKMAISW